MTAKKTITIAFFLALVPLFANAQELLLNAANGKTIKEYIDYIHLYAPSEDAFVATQRLAERFIRRKDWSNAKDIFLAYQSEFPNMKERFDKIIVLLDAPMERLKTKNLGSSINTKESEYSPIPTADESKLFFTGYNRDKTFGLEDIYVAEFIDKEWKSAKKLDFPISTKRNDAPEGVSLDGTRLFIFGSYQGSLGNGDIFYVDLKTPYAKAPVRLPPPVNSEYFDCDAKPSPDGKAIVFVSDRPGGIGSYHPIHEYFHGSYYGNTDIYVCTISDSGYSKPINLGSVINTPYAERKPFLHPDGKTLYFSSEGHYGFGRFDVFRSVRLNDTSWTDWSEPENLGKEFNTAADDWGAIISTEGNVAYIATAEREDSYGKSDIYTIEVPEQHKPDKVVVVNGIVKDHSGNPISAKIVWEDLENGMEVGQVNSEAKDGTFHLYLPLDKNYGVFGKKDSFYTTTKNVDLRTGRPFFYSKYIEIIMIPIEKLDEQYVRINNVFFEYNMAELKSESYPELDRLMKFLNDVPSINIEIQGHTDYIGSLGYNQELSEKRAQAVVNYLISKGIKPNRLSYKGFGKVKPVESNFTEEGRAMNRRVEFKILKKT